VKKVYIRELDDDDYDYLFNRLQAAVEIDYPQCVLEEDDIYEIQLHSLTHSGTLEEIAKQHARVQMQLQGLKPKNEES